MNLDWKNLVVICTEGSVPNQVNWHAGEGVFPAETCMRHIYVGLAQDFANVSQELLNNRKTTFLCGADAYVYFQEFYTGLKGHYEIDQDPSGQARAAWNTYVDKNPHSHKRLKPYMDAMFRDGSMIKTVMLNPYVARVTSANMAVRMAGLSPADRVLVVCGAEALSVKMITALGYKKKHTPDSITLTHPDRKVLERILKALNEKSLKLKRSTWAQDPKKARLLSVPFEKTLWDHDGITNIFNAQAVFVCQPMTDEKGTTQAHINQALYESWQLRSLIEIEHDAKLIHMKGDPIKWGNTSGVWNETGGICGFTPYTAVVERKNARLKLVRSVVEKSREAIRHFAQLRLEGDVVKDMTFNVRDEDMAFECRLGKRPKGAFMAKPLARVA